MKSKLEDALARQLDDAGLYFEREYRILQSRRFRADFRVWRGPFQGIERSVLVEVNGMGPGGRHGGFSHVASDAEKLSACACLGWRVLTVTGKQVRDGSALKWIRCALGVEGEPEAVFALDRSRRNTGRLAGNSLAKRKARGLSKLPERVRRAAGL